MHVGTKSVVLSANVFFRVTIRPPRPDRFRLVDGNSVLFVCLGFLRDY
jgi:hypothetical protein